MRIALVQMRIDSDSRASNLARALRWIDRACANDPSPDLVVLPAGCDGPGSGPGGPPVSVGMAQTFSQSLALKAKEWGTYVAVGFHQPLDRDCRAAGVVYDPDGDAIARLLDAAPGDTGSAAATPFAVSRTSLGCWSLLLTDKPWGADLPRKLRDADVRLAVVLGGAAPESGGPLPARCERLAREGRVHVGLAVGLAQKADEGICQVWDGTGRVLSRGTVGVEEFVLAAVVLGPGPERPAADRGGGADTPTAKGP